MNITQTFPNIPTNAIPLSYITDIYLKIQYELA